MPRKNMLDTLNEIGKDLECTIQFLKILGVIFIIALIYLFIGARA